MVFDAVSRIVPIGKEHLPGFHAALDRIAGTYVRENPEAAAAWAAKYASTDYGSRVVEEIDEAELERLIAEGRASGEKLRAEMLEETRQQQQELLDRARREIGAERDRAIQQLRAEAVDLAIAGASRVIEKDLDDASNRQLVEKFLVSLDKAPRNAR